jgi:hypothetical protein
MTWAQKASSLARCSKQNAMRASLCIGVRLNFLPATWLSSLPLTRRRAVLKEPGKPLVFTASTAVIKGLLRNLLRSTLSSSAVDVLGLPEPWRLSIVLFYLYFWRIDEIVLFGIRRSTPIFLKWRKNDGRNFLATIVHEATAT